MWHYGRDKLVVSIHLFVYFLIANLGLFAVNAVFLDNLGILLVYSVFGKFERKEVRRR